MTGLGERCKYEGQSYISPLNKTRLGLEREVRTLSPKIKKNIPKIIIFILNSPLSVIFYKEMYMHCGWVINTVTLVKLVKHI